MAGFEDSIELARRMNPGYWGEPIGEGGSFDPLTVPDISVVSIQKKLERGIGHINGDGSVATFEEGMVFDPAELPTGTVVAMSDESLSASPAVTLSKMDDFKDLPIPPRPIITVERDDEAKSIELEGFSYTASLRWGIVAERDSRGRMLYSIPASVVHRNNGNTRVSGLPKPGKGPVIIGRTGYSRSKSGSERLIRVNLLEVMAYGGS